MNCFDCYRENLQVAAAAVCRHCGGGICPGHIFETEVVITKTVPLGREVPLPVKARRFFCRVCHEALSQPR